MNPKTLIESRQLELIIERLCFQLAEDHGDFSSSVLLGIQPRGIAFAEKIRQYLLKVPGCSHIPFGKLDVTFYRDDFRRRESPLKPGDTDIPFSLEEKRVVLIDDVLYTGRTIRSAMDALMAHGRPATVQLMVLIDRRFSRQLPIEADYIGKQVDSLASQRVAVEWSSKNTSGKVMLLTS